MRGFLKYILLWVIKKKPRNGADIMRELEERKGHKPSPGTIYPALKEMKEKGLLKTDEKKTYYLTKKGDKELDSACASFCKIFHDMHEMFNCCKK